MTTDYSYAAAPDVKIKSSKKIEKGIKNILIIAGVILAAQLIWLFIISPFIPFSTVDTRGFDGFERHEILTLAGIDDSSSFISTNANEAREKLSTHVLVESAMVIKRFPDRLSIFLTPRQAAAVALANINGKQSLVYVDRNGVFFKVEDNAARDITIPIISGLDNPQVFMRLPDALVPLTRSLSVIALSSPELVSAISEIRIERKPWEGYDLVLFPVHSSIRVRVENNLTEDMLRYILLMLNVFNANDPKPQEIDFRSGMGSFRIREQFPEVPAYE